MSAHYPNSISGPNILDSNSTNIIVVFALSTSPTPEMVVLGFYFRAWLPGGWPTKKGNFIWLSHAQFQQYLGRKEVTKSIFDKSNANGYYIHDIRASSTDEV